MRYLFCSKNKERQIDLSQSLVMVEINVLPGALLLLPVAVVSK